MLHNLESVKMNILLEIMMGENIFNQLTVNYYINHLKALNNLKGLMNLQDQKILESNNLKKKI